MGALGQPPAVTRGTYTLMKVFSVSSPVLIAIIFLAWLGGTFATLAAAGYWFGMLLTPLCIMGIGILIRYRCYVR